MHPALTAEKALDFIDSDRTISMDLKDADLKDVLKIFSMQAGLNFIASQNVEERKITLYMDKVPIKQAMEKLFRANNLSCEYDEDSNIFTVQYWGDPEAQTITRVYKLKHRSVSASNIEREKEALLSKVGFVSSVSGSDTAAGASSSQRSANQSQGTDIVGAIKQILSKQGKVSEDKRTNSLIVTDIPSKFPAIEEVIASLDTPDAQVMLEVEMLDVSKDVMDQLGFNIGTKDVPNPFTWILPGGLGGSKFFIGDLTYRKTGIDYPSSVQPQNGRFVFGSSYAAILDFLSMQSDTKYLARPRILTLDNETAEIGITRDEIVSSSLKTETLEGGSTITSKEYERATSLSLTPEGIGIFLRVTPQINLETREITMVINPKTSSAVQSSEIEGEIARDPEVRSAKSIVKVKDGETVVMGGLIHKEKQETTTKVPIFGDIPVIGAFFRHKDVNKNIDRELLVFITPRIVNDQTLRLAQTPRQSQPLAGGYPVVNPQRQETINSMMNIFERKKN
jgi:type II secretory pathway component GspD/PulD (secretin)